MEDFLGRSRLIFGDKMKNIEHAHVLVVGLGGVGSYVVEGLVRAGVSELSICDYDTIDVTNLNRQLHTHSQNIGKSKAKELAKRIKLINPDIKVNVIEVLVDKDNVDELLSVDYDYVCDAIDMVSSKLLLIKKCKNLGIPIISSMGTGNKLDPTQFEIADIYKTSVCPLAKVMRKELKALGVPSLKVLYSKEPSLKCFVEKEGKKSPASVSFVPSVAGLIIAGEIIKDLAYGGDR